MDLRSLADRQGGVVTRKQALDSGLSPAAVRTLLRSGRWTALAGGVYAPAASLDPGPGARHVLEAAARVLTSGLGVVASHRTAALVHGLPLLGRPPVVPQLTRAPRFRGDSSADRYLYVAGLAEADTTERGGIPVTSLARTAVDVARRADFRSGVVTADGALRAGLHREELGAVAHACRGWPGGARAVRAAAFADERAETPLESITRVAYHWEGLPPPETQVEVRDPRGRLVALVDFLWRAQRTVGEADGLMKYDGYGVLRREKLREEDVRRWGLEVVRNVWDDVWAAPGRRELARRVRQAFELSAVRPPVPGVHFRTPSLAELTRLRARFPDRVAS
ncbi:MAG: Transcriptional regulator, AbiEi antitoxin, Type system [Frankiales bacterium]|nr:Transcriptional regulator, AbiEi antitoxin, Type system [Frankiales bacterium]